MAVIVGAVAAAAFLCATSAGGSLYDGDEAVYGQFAREMRESGDWLTLRLFGHPIHQRPPGYVWLLAAATALFGETELALRLVSILSFGATVVGVFALSRRLAKGATRPALAAAILFAGLALPWRYARAVESDPLLALLVTLAVERLVAAREAGLSPPARSRRYVAFGALVGASAMVKQGIGLLPLAALAAVALARPAVAPTAPGGSAAPGSLAPPAPPPSPRPSRRDLALAAVAGVAVWLPWHAFATLRHGGAFWATYLGFNVVERALRPVLLATPVTFYAEAILRREGPVLAAALAGVLVATTAAAARRRSEADLIACLPTLLALALFSLARSRVEYYLVVVTPLWAACAARVVAPDGLCGRFAARAPLFALGLAAAGLATRGLPALAPLDPSAAVRALAETAGAMGRAVGPGEPPARLVVVGLQPSAAAYYSRLPTTRLVLDAGAYRRLVAIDVFSFPGALWHAKDAHAACAPQKDGGRRLWLVRAGPDADALAAAGCLGPVLARRGSLALHGGPLPARSAVARPVHSVTPGVLSAPPAAVARAGRRSVVGSSPLRDRGGDHAHRGSPAGGAGHLQPAQHRASFHARVPLGTALRRAGARARLRLV